MPLKTKKKIKKRDRIIEQTFDIIYFGKKILISRQLHDIFLCEALKIPYRQGGLRDQPAWFIKMYPAFLTGKNKAEEALAKKKK